MNSENKPPQIVKNRDDEIVELLSSINQYTKLNYKYTSSINLFLWGYTIIITILVIGNMLKNVQ